MIDPTTFTAEHRSWQWELVLRYEDGSLPAAEWNPSTLGVVASWYAKHLTREQATTRYEQYFHRNRHRRGRCGDDLRHAARLRRPHVG